MSEDKPIRRKLLRWISWGCGASLLIVLALVTYAFNGNLFDNTVLDPVMKHEMLSTAREWGRLAPLPDSAENFVIESSGSMFTRTFEASFHAPSADIENWLEASPGTQNPVPVEEEAPEDEPVGRNSLTESKVLDKSGVWYYDIKPAGGAAFAGVWVDVARELVRFKVYWS